MSSFPEIKSSLKCQSHLSVSMEYARPYDVKNNVVYDLLTLDIADRALPELNVSLSRVNNRNFSTTDSASGCPERKSSVAHRGDRTDGNGSPFEDGAEKKIAAEVEGFSSGLLKVLCHYLCVPVTPELKLS